MHRRIPHREVLELVRAEFEAARTAGRGRIDAYRIAIEKWRPEDSKEEAARAVVNLVETSASPL